MDLQLNSAPPRSKRGLRRAACRRRAPWRCRRRICATSRRGARGARLGAAVLYARFILVTVTVGVTTYGVYQMLQVVRFASMTLLQGLMIFFFAVSLGWIAFAAGSVSGRRLEAARSRPAARTQPRVAHGAGDADLQRRSAAHHGGAAGHGAKRWRASTRIAASRS